MNRKLEPVAVCSRSFSRNPLLRKELLSRYVNVSFNESGNQLEGEGLISFLQGHQKAIVALEKITDDILAQLPELKVIAKYGVGLDMLDLEAIHQRGIALGWAGGVNRRSVSELTIALIISLLRKISQSQREVRSGLWQQHIGSQLSGKTVGIIGCGHIGKDIVQLLRPWGCDLIAHDIIDYSNFYSENGVRPDTLSNLLRQSDIVTLHVPLNQATKRMISKDQLKLMKNTAILINTARGGLIDENEVKKMLINGELAGAAFDVFENEPPSDMELLTLNNFMSTPHIGGSSQEAIFAMGMAAIEGLELHSLPY